MIAVPNIELPTDQSTKDYGLAQEQKCAKYMLEVENKSKDQQ